MSVKITRRKQGVSFEDRLRKAADEAGEAASKLPQGQEREASSSGQGGLKRLLKFDGCLTPPGLQSER
jgi:hypothetical protein